MVLLVPVVLQPPVGCRPTIRAPWVGGPQDPLPFSGEKRLVDPLCFKGVDFSWTPWWHKWEPKKKKTKRGGQKNKKTKRGGQKKKKKGVWLPPSFSSLSPELQACLAFRGPPPPGYAEWTLCLRLCAFHNGVIMARKRKDHRFSPCFIISIRDA